MAATNNGAAIDQLVRPEVVLHGLKDQPKGWLSWLTTTDHKRIGIMYLFVTFLFFILGLSLIHISEPTRPY